MNLMSLLLVTCRVVFSQRIRFLSLKPRIIFGIFSVFSGCQANANAVTLEQVIALALNNDPVLINSQYQEQATLAESRAANALPDPTLSFGVLNLPTDSFDFSQENMTQLNVGVKQQFPRGKSLEIKQNLLQRQAAEQPLQRDVRQADVTRQVSELWYQLNGANTLIHQLQTDRTLFEQLIEAAKARYASALMQTNQQQILQAELALARLDNQITQQQQDAAAASASLLEWLGKHRESIKELSAPPHLPAISALPRNITDVLRDSTSALGINLLDNHPLLLHAKQQFTVSQQHILLAQQLDEPQWGLSASYAYRDNQSELNNERADFFSLGVSVSIPLWNSTKNREQLRAATLKSEGIKTKHRLLQQQMFAQLQQLVSEDSHLLQQIARYTTSIIPTQMRITDITATAFASDKGKFEDVVRSRIELLNTKVALIKLQIQLHQARARLRYLLTGSDIATISVSLAPNAHTETAQLAAVIRSMEGKA